MRLQDQLPQDVRNTALSLGPPGEAWLTSLDDQIVELCARWDLSVVQPMHGGREACIVEVVGGNGRPAVLKLAPPGDAFAGELAALRLAEGRGYPLVYEVDPAQNAVLLERLGSQLAEFDWPIDAQLEAICATLARAWTIAPANAELMTGATKATWLADQIATLWEELGRPCAERTIAHALACAERRRRAHDPAAAVLVHGDAHAWNTLAAADGVGFKLVDPDGLAAEAAYDLAIPMREWSEELLAGDPVRLGRERCARLARLTGVEPTPIWEWGVVERV